MGLLRVGGSGLSAQKRHLGLPGRPLLRRAAALWSSSPLEALVVFFFLIYEQNSGGNRDKFSLRTARAEIGHFSDCLWHVLITASLWASGASRWVQHSHPGLQEPRVEAASADQRCAQASVWRGPSLAREPLQASGCGEERWELSGGSSATGEEEEEDTPDGPL